MRRFHSYGPVNCEEHFCVPRKRLIEKCAGMLLEGSYFTIWAPPQTGKTWLMQQAIKKIEAEYGEQFITGCLSIQGLHFEEATPEEFFEYVPQLFLEGFNLHVPKPKHWGDWRRLFFKRNGVFDRPLLLFIDEFDSLPDRLMDILMSSFREMYLDRESTFLHGLGLPGLHSVLYVESERCVPFNVQKNFHVPNFTLEEVKELYQHYQDESGQPILPEVIEAVYTATHGHPGLTSWFGELLNETYNPGHDHSIDMECWNKTRFHQPNDMMRNVIAKAQESEQHTFLLRLFSDSSLDFSFDNPICNDLYVHGIVKREHGEEMCRFSSPYVQQCLFLAFCEKIIGEIDLTLVEAAAGNLTDIFEGQALNLPALLQCYKDYLARLKAKGIHPWKEQPRCKTGGHLMEPVLSGVEGAVGHFHLYAWLKEALHDLCVVSPEFPTGNGKVDIHLRCGKKRGIIEVKSFRSASRLKKDKQDVSAYAKGLGLDTVTMAVFVPVEDETVLEKLSGEEVIQGVRVIVAAIGWM